MANDLTTLNALYIRRGNKRVWTFKVGAVLTGATINFAVYPTYPAGDVVSDAGALIAKSTATAGIVITAEDEFELTIAADDTRSINISGDFNTYVYGAEYIPNGETDPQDLGSGDFYIFPDVVRA